MATSFLAECGTTEREQQDGEDSIEKWNDPIVAISHKLNMKKMMLVIGCLLFNHESSLKSVVHPDCFRRNVGWMKYGIRNAEIGSELTLPIDYK
jgi:hypothetical protein